MESVIRLPAFIAQNLTVLLTEEPDLQSMTWTHIPSTIHGPCRLLLPQVGLAGAPQGQVGDRVLMTAAQTHRTGSPEQDTPAAEGVTTW